jgi:hypothetical protein
MNSAVEDSQTSNMDVLDTLKTYIIAEAKSVGSEEVTSIHLFAGISNLLSKRSIIDEDHPMAIIASALHEEELAKGLDGYKTPEFSVEVTKLIKDIKTLDDLQGVAEILMKDVDKLDMKKAKKISKKETNIPKQPIAIGGFHNVNGSSIGRLPKYMPNKEDAAVLIDNFLMAGEVYVWDGVYNTKDNHLSTRRSTQSMGRVFVTNTRLIFWSDDEDKPHIGVLYNDIESWKTSWMPLKSRGVVMYVGGQKVIFAANSTAMEHATTQMQIAK